MAINGHYGDLSAAQQVFDDIDTDDDRRIDLREFKVGMQKLDLHLSEDEAETHSAFLFASQGHSMGPCNIQ